MSGNRRGAGLIILGIVLLLAGLALWAGGVWLIVLGGSWYYAIAGVLLLVSGLLLLARSPHALSLYALLVIGTLVWSLWEVGLDWWPLAARGGVIIVLGVLLLLPFATYPLKGASRTVPGETEEGVTSALRGPGLSLTAAILLAFCVAGVSLVLDPHRTEGRIAEAAAPQDSGTDGASDEAPEGDWPVYGRTQAGQRYSPLNQITPQNVADLEVAWTYHTGDIRGPGDPEETTFQVTPLKIGDRLFLCTPHQNVIALDAVSGEEIWRYEPEVQGELALQHLTCRGLTYQAEIPAAPAAGAEETVQAGGTDTASTPAPGGQPAPAPADGNQPQPGPVGETPAPAAAPDSQIQAETTPAGETQPEGAGPASGEAETAAVAGGEGDAPIAGAQNQPAEPTDDPGLPVAAQAGASAACTSRLFMPTADGRLIALNPDTGEVCSDFGGGTGQINLWSQMPNVNPGSYYSTSPVIVTENIIVVGGTVLDNVSTQEASGVIRGYNAATGDLVWAWDSGNPDRTEPLAEGETYTPNSPNSWSIMSVDEDLGLVYVPLGNQPPDQFGGDRSEAVERFSSSVVALDVATGQVRWDFQTVHHDLWDYDVPSQPTLVDLTVNGQNVPALVQPTKQGELFVLNRETGEPILPVTETEAPQGAAEGDFTAPTQPVSALSFQPEPLTGADMWGATLFDQLACRISLASHRYEGRFTPPSLEGSIVYPGNFGVFNWGGVAIDPVRQIAFTTPTYLAFTSQLVPRENDQEMYVQGGTPPQGALPALNENFGAPYAVKMGPFMSPIGIPCQSPPWGYVAAADLTTGEVIWQHKNGTTRDITPLPLPFELGVPNLGGPMLTAGGVAFLSGTIDDYVRGYDVTTGEEIWRARLPAGGQATPMSYQGADGRQYVLVVAGGHGSLGTKAGDAVIAYALPGE